MDTRIFLTASSPPHTRGSTWSGTALVKSYDVSPAHAGIDPIGTTDLPARPGLPRTRGDRPRSTISLSVIFQSPPHTRGSTLVGNSGDAPSDVSPAHAGIDLPRDAGAGYWWGLPRTRGDRPAGYISFLAIVQSPPHTRGSTL